MFEDTQGVIDPDDRVLRETILNPRRDAVEPIFPSEFSPAVISYLISLEIPSPDVLFDKEKIINYLKKRYGSKVTLYDFETLKGGMMLNDIIIDEYMELIRQRGERSGPYKVCLISPINANNN